MSLNQKKIEIIIDENGNITIETLGFSGKACVEESQWVKDILGEEIARELKPVYFSTEKEKVTKKRHLPICG